MIADDRLMQQVRVLDNSLTIIEALLPKRVFDVRQARESIALSGQSSQPVIPELVSAGADGFLQLDYALLAVHLVGATKTLIAAVRDLQTRAAVSPTI